MVDFSFVYEELKYKYSSTIEKKQKIFPKRLNTCY